MIKNNRNSPKMVAFCGIICTKCPAFIATSEDSEPKRKDLAELWSKEFNTEIKPEDINCDGCLLVDKRLFSYCQICEVRKCGLEKNIKNCAYCDKYICEKLAKWFNKVPYAKVTLEEIRKGL